jgi:hypothetical protein
MVPIFLAKHKEKILHSGKYLNVIRECGKDVHYPWPEHENMFLNGFKLKSNQQSGEDEEMKEADNNDLNASRGLNS